MAQRQFRSDDTSLWIERYGLGTLGAVTETTRTDAPIDSAITGTSGTASCVGTNASFVAGQLVYIEQSRGGTGSDVNHEFNVITGYATGAVTLKYPLTNTYTTGAQLIVIDQNRTWNLNGATLTAKAWDGSVGGVIIRFASQSISGSGTIALTGKGFRGATGRAANGGGKQGEGYAGTRDTESAATNGSGAGGGTNNNGAGAGGGNGAVGGTGTGGSGSLGGLVSGNAALTSSYMGGGGSSGSNQSGAGTSGVGGSGGGKILLFAPSIDISGMTGISINGGAGAASTGSDGSPGPGGGGAGGSGVIKGQRIVLGTAVMTATGGASASGGGNTSGTGGVGRIAVYYSQTVSGTTSPAYDSNLDLVLNDLSSMLIMF